MSAPEPIEVPVEVLPHGEGLDLPAYETAGAAGMDLLAGQQDRHGLTGLRSLAGLEQERIDDARNGRTVHMAFARSTTPSHRSMRPTSRQCARSVTPMPTT